jgi:hypothetical protein
MTKHTRTYYTVETLVFREFSDSEGHWSMMGSGPGGHTIEQARDRVRKEMERIGIERLDRKVKFRITKKIEIEETAEEVLGNEATFFMLKG